MRAEEDVYTIVCIGGTNVANTHTHTTRDIVQSDINKRTLLCNFAVSRNLG